jgi:Tol biopolymer transport system component
MVNADGSGLRPLTRGMDGSPTWSADGRAIAFDRSVRGTRQIRRKAADGGRSRTIARRACCPVWSPDGRTIAFLKTGAPRSLWLMRSDGRGKHLVPGVPRGQEIVDLAWSPDGRYLAYYVYCCRESGIYVTRLDGAYREHLWWGPEFLGISWGP